MSSEETSNIDSEVNSTVATASSSPALNNTPTAAVTAATTATVRSGEFLENHCRILEDEVHILKDSESKLKQQYADSQRRERILARRLAVKEQEMQDYASQIAELKTAQAPGPAALRSALLDPAVNILFQKLKAELQTTKAKLEETQNELSAWKFTPDSNTGKRLMAKCRLLYQENEELGKMTSNGRLAKLEGELALQKSYNEEVKKSQLELDDFLQELDEDVEGMQSTIVFLQQELKLAKDTIQELEKEIILIKTSSPTNGAAAEDDEHEDKFIVNGNNKLNKCSSDELLNRTHNSNVNPELRTTTATQFSQLNGGVDEQIFNNNKNSNSLNGNNKTSKLSRNNNRTNNSKKRNYNEDNENEDGHHEDVVGGEKSGKKVVAEKTVDNEDDDNNGNSEQSEQQQNEQNCNKRMTRSIKCKNNLKLMNNNKKLRRSNDEDDGTDITNGGN